MKEIKKSSISSKSGNKSEIIQYNNVSITTPSESIFRNAFKMKLKPNCKAEYKRRHDEIWPELSQILKDAGISDYSIYLDEETNTLFAFQKLAHDNTADQLPNTTVVQKWWSYMSDIMEYNVDNTPVAIPLDEMFHMD